MALNSQEIDAIQNSVPTDWSAFDQQLNDRQGPDAGRFAMDKRLHVRFFTKPRYNPDKSAEQNRPIYEDTEYVEIMMPGEKHNIISRPAASMRDDQRFPEQYKQFKAGQADQINGTPLKVLPFLSEAQVEELAYFKVRTVEQLADLNDTVQFMGAVEMKQRAKRWLDQSQSGEALHATIGEQARQIADQARQLNELRQMLEQRTAPENRAPRAGDAKSVDDILN